MSKTITTEVDVDVDLEDFSDGELTEELRSRGIYAYGGKMQVEAAINALRNAGVPTDLIMQLEEWEHQPIVTREKLENWLHICGVK